MKIVDETFGGIQTSLDDVWQQNMWSRWTLFHFQQNNFGIKIFKVVGSQLKYYLCLALFFQLAIPKLNSNDSTKQDTNLVSK